MKSQFVWFCIALLAQQGLAAEPTPAQPLKTFTVEELAKHVRPSLVSITTGGREGGQRGLGTGFVIDGNLIVTNLHVIGEGFPFLVELSDGTNLIVKEVHASDHALDLAIIAVDPGDKPLAPLPLGDSSAIAQGAAVVAMGNPHGFKHSVVAGVVSSKRQLEGRAMLQLAMPIEPGNSGGPTLDMHGRVVGIVNMKSAVEQNLGFAIEANLLKPMLEKPNPISIARWITIGGIDAKQWQPLFGANWRQRGGRVLVAGAGEGFGGRSLCLLQTATPEPPFEVGVRVKMNDESGAAGLVFHADGGDKHYGFYPSSGRLRLTCFQGPDVNTWQVLRELPMPVYRPGDWNSLRVRVEADRFQCFVNDELVVESTDRTLTTGKVGLAKFRHTEAEFKQFQIGREIRWREPAKGEVERIAAEVDKLPRLSKLPIEQLQEMAKASDLHALALRRRAKELEQRVEELRRLADDVRVSHVAGELGRLVNNRDDGFDLLRAALLIANLEAEEIDVDEYVAQVDRMAAEITAELPDKAAEGTKLTALHVYLFEKNGFRGSRFDYYHRANSLMNRVLDDRAGLPITLSILHMELGRRLGLKIEGVGLPAHFVTRFVPSDGPSQLIDVYERGRLISRDDAARIVRELTETNLQDAHLAAQTPRQILQRMIGNLWGLAREAGDGEAMLRLTEALVAIDPDSAEQRLRRAQLRGASGRTTAAIADLDWLIDKSPPGADIDSLRAIRAEIGATLR